MHGLVVRPADEAELGRIVELLVLGAVPGGRAEHGRSRRARPVPGRVRATSSSVTASCWSPTCDGAVVGVCQLIVFRHLQAHGGLCAEIESVHVHPDHRGAGVGGALMGDAIARARGLGCYRVQLTSNVARPEAHRFYERLGFVPSHIGFKLSLE